MSRHGRRIRTTAILLSIPLVLAAVYGFSGEDILRGDPWHHEQISERALERAGFSAGAAETVAWHADYLDSYLYNPLWWADVSRGGGIDRLKVSLASYDHLARLHFDDLFGRGAVERAWHRYLTGTVAGLAWAAEHGDVAAAHNVLGVSLHAVQDFYSHSNWIDDPARRGRTWFVTSTAVRDRLDLRTGAYEHPERRGIEHHGKYAPACTVLNRSAVSSFLADVGCLAISPMSNSSVCHQWKACDEGRAVGLSVAGAELPADAVYLAPPGIAVDNTWVAAIGGIERGLFDERGRWRSGRDANVVTGAECRDVIDHGEACDGPNDELFATAKQLATEASVQWLSILDEAMGEIDASFWERVKRTSTAGAKERQYERYHRFPYHFLSAGPYPPDPGGLGGATYLRVRLRTSGARNAGTDADIRLVAQGDAHLLDYMPRANPFVAYNDFERGDDQVYTIGPFDGVPREITLENRAADAGDVLRSLGETFAEGVVDGLETVRVGLLSIIGGNADLVDDGRQLWGPDDLARIGAEPEGFRIGVDGGSEGHFRLEGTIRRISESDEEAEYEVRVTRLVCIEESDWDRGSNSDEPFVLSMLLPFPGDGQGRLFGPFTDVDDGESRRIDFVYRHVRVPKEHGWISLPIMVMESDDEPARDRRRLQREFEAEISSVIEVPEERFLDTLGRAIAADWKVGSIEVVAFRRGERIEVGTVLSERVEAWIEGGESRTFRLDRSGMRRLPVTAEELTRWESPLVVDDRVFDPDVIDDVRDPLGDRRVPIPVPDVGGEDGGEAAADCLSYDPRNLAVRRIGADWIVADGDHRMLALASRAEARTARDVARRHTRLCFVGRGNDRAERDRYVFSWMAGDSGVDPRVEREDCLPYDASDLRVVDEGARGFLVTDGRSRIQMLATRADAERVVEVMRDHSARCFVGRDNDRPDRRRYIVSYLKE